MSTSPVFRALSAFSIFFVLQVGLNALCSLSFLAPPTLLAAGVCLTLFAFFTALFAAYAPLAVLQNGNRPNWLTYYHVGLVACTGVFSAVSFVGAYGLRHEGAALARLYFLNGSAMLTVASIVITGAAIVAAMLEKRS